MTERILTRWRPHPTRLFRAGRNTGPLRRRRSHTVVSVAAAFLTALVVTVSALPASACTTCQCGSTPNASLAVGAPSGGTWRLLAQPAYQRLRIGANDAGALRLQEARIDFTFAWMTRSGWGAGVQQPLVLRQTQLASGSTEGGMAPSDLALFVDRRLSAPWARVNLLLAAGLRLPTSPTLRAGGGGVVNQDAQPGVAAWTPFMSLFVQRARGVWQPFASVSWVAPLRSRHEFSPGMVGLTTAGIIRNLGRFSAQLTTDARLEQPDRFDQEAGSTVDPDSGGLTVFVSPGVWAALSDSVSAGMVVRLPALQPTRGAQHEGVISQLTLLVTGRRDRRARETAPELMTMRGGTNALPLFSQSR